MFGPYTTVEIMTLAVFFLAAAGDHFTTGYIAASSDQVRELSPLYNMLKSRITIQQFVNISSAIKVIGGVFIFVVAPFLIIVPTLLVCTAPTFNMFWLWNHGRRRSPSALGRTTLATDQPQSNPGEPL